MTDEPKTELEQLKQARNDVLAKYDRFAESGAKSPKLEAEFQQAVEKFSALVKTTIESNGANADKAAKMGTFSAIIIDDKRNIHWGNGKAFGTDYKNLHTATLQGIEQIQYTVENAKHAGRANAWHQMNTSTPVSPTDLANNQPGPRTRQ